MTTAVAFRITPSGSAIIESPAEPDPTLTTKTKFNDEFVERRMRQHRELLQLTALKLDTPIEWMRYCYCCDREQRFCADRVCANGLVGCCSKCGEERIAPFTRTTAGGAL
jgi:hypothetical protein